MSSAERTVIVAAYAPRCVRTVLHWFRCSSSSHQGVSASVSTSTARKARPNAQPTHMPSMDGTAARPWWLCFSVRLRSTVATASSPKLYANCTEAGASSVHARLSYWPPQYGSGTIRKTWELKRSSHILDAIYAAVSERKSPIVGVARTIAEVTTSIIGPGAHRHMHNPQAYSVPRWQQTPISAASVADGLPSS
eukprot:scaffold124827_cov63-Phaeocystis_antarctica.AAC.3